MNTAQFLSEMDTLVRELKENTLNKDYAVTKTDRTLAEIEPKIQIFVTQMSCDYVYETKPC